MRSKDIKCLGTNLTKICAKTSYRKRLDIAREIFTDLNNGNIYYVHELVLGNILYT